ncbi:MAG: hypothetical protein A2868_00685 [Candidatus Levybacteria bacterium RIFCSPHIGHO2_01_FULL_40_15b]|nr:MAG: hypothetical protein A2868_00685 [Candidatus Levybacteria bacterium RIFCSPHIGHO2_01_FULL_40_15b]
MKLLKIFKLQKRSGNLNIPQAGRRPGEASGPEGKVVDFYQDSIEKIGRDQFKKLVEKGLNIPVFAL